QVEDRVKDQAVPLRGPAPAPAGAPRRREQRRQQRQLLAPGRYVHPDSWYDWQAWTALLLRGVLHLPGEPPTDRARGRTLASSGGSARHLTPLPTPSTNARQWWWPCRRRVSTGVAPGRVHCGTGRLVGPQVAFPSASERQYQQIGEP